MTTQPEILVQDIDHLGIIAGIIDEMGLVEEIDRQLGTPQQQQVSAGQVIKAMILNGLGFVSAPLYLFEQFFVGKATEHLLGEGVRPEHLNDDRLGRVLDKLHKAGLSQVFLKVALEACKKFGVSTSRVHLDSSSFHEDNLQSLGELPWICRVPATLTQAKQLLQAGAELEWVTSSLEGYRIAQQHSNYGGIEQRWLIVESQALLAAQQSIKNQLGKATQTPTLRWVFQ